jgi:hypothetical protein
MPPTFFGQLPQRNPPRVSEPPSGRIFVWGAYLSFGFFARLWLLGVWIFSDLLGDAFGSWVIPVLGFFLVPWTTLMYAYMWLISSNGVAGWEWIVVGIALLVDFLFWVWSRSMFT